MDDPGGVYGRCREGVGREGKGGDGQKACMGR